MRASTRRRFGRVLLAIVPLLFVMQRPAVACEHAAAGLPASEVSGHAGHHAGPHAVDDASAMHDGHERPAPGGPCDHDQSAPCPHPAMPSCATSACTATIAAVPPPSTNGPLAPSRAEMPSPSADAPASVVAAPEPPPPRA